MLSRSAENLFWMARNMERAENTARMLDVSFRMSLLPSTLDKQALHFEPILAIAPGDGSVVCCSRLGVKHLFTLMPSQHPIGQPLDALG